jgi:hypothetical protein
MEIHRAKKLTSYIVDKADEIDLCGRNRLDVKKEFEYDERETKKWWWVSRSTWGWRPITKSEILIEANRHCYPLVIAKLRGRIIAKIEK